MGSNKFNNHVYRTQEKDVWVDGEDIPVEFSSTTIVNSTWLFKLYFIRKSVAMKAGVDFDDLAMYCLHDV